MRKLIVRCLIAAALLAVAASGARAAELFTHTYDVQGGFEGTAGDLAVSLSVMTGIESTDWATVTFGHFTPADVGRTVTLTPAFGGDFTRVIDRLTDGTRHTIYFEWMTAAGGGGLGSAEPSIIWGDFNDPRVDLAGYQIDSLGVRVDRLSFTVQNPGAPRTDVSGSFTLIAEGHLLPEPSGAMMLLALAGVGALRRRPVGSRPRRVVLGWGNGKGANQHPR